MPNKFLSEQIGANIVRSIFSQDAVLSRLDLGGSSVKWLEILCDVVRCDAGQCDSSA